VYTSTNMGCEYGEFDETNGKCKFKRYWYYSAETDWYAGKNKCESLGAHLATIMSAEENSQVVSFLAPIGSMWIGLNKMPGTWVWDTGEPVVFINWYRDPSGDGSCVELYGSEFNGGWNDLACTGRHYRPSLCEWDWEFGAVGVCPEGYTYEKEGDYGYCYGSPVVLCPEGYVYDSSMRKCLGDPE